jgi:diguanylate cyclase (GGDEF)-like protein/PAS domain S-box-containing protein
MITSPDGSILEVNEAFIEITGYSRDEVLGANPRILRSDCQTYDFYTEMFAHLEREGHWQGVIWNRRKNGTLFAINETISAVRNSAGVLQHYVSLFSDITALKEHQLRLERSAHFDALTDLPNRLLLMDRLHQAMTQAQRRNEPLALVFLDLDGFKAVNDQHGHAVGDDLLKALAMRMRAALRDGDTLARLGGDEFVAILVDLPQTQACTPLLHRLLHAASQWVQLESLQLQVSASLGVTFYPQTTEVKADLLLRQADQAMYQAKMGGKNRFHFYPITNSDNPPSP